MSSRAVSRVAVVGGGISGLACAHRLLELAPQAEVTLFERAPRTGGIIGTLHRDGCVVELGPDSILTEKPAAMNLVARLGLQAKVIGTRAKPRGAFVVARGQLQKIPDAFSMMGPARFLPVLSSSILSPRGKLRLLAEPFLPRGSVADESVGRFVRRRFGREVLERLAQPLMGGIYGTDVELLSLGATMPKFLELERDHGSVTLGLRRKARAKTNGAAAGVRYGLFISFTEGVQTLVDALAHRLSERVRTGRGVHGLERHPNGHYTLHFDDGTSHDCDAVVLALPARPMSRVVSRLDAELAERLLDIPYGSTAAVTLCYQRADVPHALDGFGFVVPKVEQRRVLASTWASVKFEGRAPEGQALLRVFFGGDGHEATLDLEDAELVRVAREELGELIGVRAAPRWEHVVRHPHAMPKYLLGHAQRVDAIERRVRAYPGLELAGNSLHGVGIPDAIRSGEAAAERVVAAPGLVGAGV